METCEKKTFWLTKNVDEAGGGSNTVSILHVDGEVTVIGSASITDHQHSLTLLGLIQTQTLTQWSHKLLLWFRNLKATKEVGVINSLKTKQKHKNIPDLLISNLGLPLLL